MIHESVNGKTTANTEGIAIRQAKVLKGKAEGKNQREIAKEVGISQPTVSRDWRELNQDASIQEALRELKSLNLLNAIEATQVEAQFIKQINGKESLTTQETDTSNRIKVSSQKVYSGLQGAGTDDKGGDTAAEALYNLISNNSRGLND